MNIAVLIAIIGAAATMFGGAVTWAVSQRAKSGDVKTSEAGQLWDESKAIRDWQTEQLAKRDERIKALEDQQREAEKQQRETERTYQADLRARDATIAELTRKVAERDARLAAVEGRLAVLEQKGAP